MPIIENHGTHRPSSNSLDAWLGTRKSEVRGIPGSYGYYTTFRPDTDATWWWFGVLGEILGIALTLYGGISKGGVFILISILAVILFVVVDITFGIKLHRNKSTKTKNKNRVYVLENIGEDIIPIVGDHGAFSLRDRVRLEIGRLSQENNIELFKDILMKLAIIFMCVLKILAILLLGTFNIVSVIPIAIIYSIVVYVHFYHTGYYFAERKTQRMFDLDYNIWINQEGGWEALSVPDVGQTTIFKSNFDLRKEPELLDRHVIHELGGNANHRLEFIKSEEGTEKPFEYAITTKGVLLDEEITKMLDGFNPGQRAILSPWLLYHQQNN